MDTCRKCETDLVIGNNITQARYDNQDYCCSSCMNFRRRVWYKKTPEKFRKEKKAKYDARSDSETIWHSCKARASRNKIPFDLLVEDIIIPPVCPILGIPLFRNSGGGTKDNSPSIDRFDPIKGYTKDNVTIISNRANRIKNNATADELFQIYQWMQARKDK